MSHWITAITKILNYVDNIIMTVDWCSLPCSLTHSLSSPFKIQIVIKWETLCNIHLVVCIVGARYSPCYKPCFMYAYMCMCVCVLISFKTRQEAFLMTLHLQNTFSNLKSCNQFKNSIVQDERKMPHNQQQTDVFYLCNDHHLLFNRIKTAHLIPHPVPSREKRSGK